jgi:hypothetical protein
MPADIRCPGLLHRISKTQSYGLCFFSEFAGANYWLQHLTAIFIPLVEAELFARE